MLPHCNSGAPHREAGFTLIEWLISSSIGVGLLALICQLYFNLLKTFIFVEDIHRTHENTTVAFHFLTRDIRHAGFIGCPHLEAIHPIRTMTYPFEKAIIGWHQGAFCKALPLPIQKSLKSSDVLCVQYADPHRIPIIKAQNQTIQCAQKPSFLPGTIVLVSDCRHAEIVEWGKIKLKHTYSDDATISPFHRIVYYIAPREQKPFKKRVYTLHRKDLNTPDAPTALVDNIQKLELRYGVLTDDTELRYFTASQVRNWKAVRTVHIILHVALSDTHSRAQPSSFSRSTFCQTIAIRSRVLSLPYIETYTHYNTVLS